MYVCVCLYTAYFQIWCNYCICNRMVPECGKHTSCTSDTIANNTHSLTQLVAIKNRVLYWKWWGVYNYRKKWLTSLCEIVDFFCLCHHCSNSEVIGSGNFSLVSKGEWSTPSGPCMVAIKHASGNNATLRMLQEAVVMVQLWHPNVVNLLGMLERQKSVSMHIPNLLTNLS